MNECEAAWEKRGGKMKNGIDKEPNNDTFLERIENDRKNTISADATRFDR